MVGRFGSYKGAFTYFKVIFLILPALLLISLMTLWGKGRGSAETEKVVYVNPAGLEGGGVFQDLQQALDSSPPDSVFFCAGDLGAGEIEITQPARILSPFFEYNALIISPRDTNGFSFRING